MLISEYLRFDTRSLELQASKRNALVASYEQDYLLAVARGAVPGAEPFGGFGERTTTGAVVSGLLWPNGALYIPASTGVQPSIVSTSANDAAAGTGIRSVEVHYLDANLDPRAEFVTLNGLTPVPMAATDVRFIQDVHAYTVGSGGYSAGAITASFAGGTLAEIGASNLRGRSTARMVPRGKYGFVNAAISGAASGTATSEVHIELVATELDTHQFTQKGLFFAYGEVAVQDNSAGLSFPTPLRFKEGTIIAMTFTCDKAALVTGTWFGWLEDV